MQRRFIRHPTRIPIACRKQGHEAEASHELRNISCGGLSFVSDHSYDPGDIVEITYPTLRLDGSLCGKIIWTEEIDDVDPVSYINGMKFMDEQAHYHARIVEQICHIETYRREQLRLGRKLGSQEAATEWIASCADHFPE